MVFNSIAASVFRGETSRFRAARTYGSVSSSSERSAAAATTTAAPPSPTTEEEQENLLSPEESSRDGEISGTTDGNFVAPDTATDDNDEEEEEEEEENVEERQAEIDTADEIDDHLTSLTRRLRCLFSVVTWPIVPFGSISILALIWLLYASFVLDINKSCSHPLHWYSILSSVFLLYLPFHTSIRSYFFHYDRERDGPNRPTSVRRYDQCFNTVALLYVYCGITLVQTCRDDVLVPDNNSIDAEEENGNIDMGLLKNSCTATCPNTFASLRVYVACLELFVLSLIIPLLFLPCLYLYFVRRTMRDAEALSILQDRLREEEAVRRNGGITADEILEYFEIIQLVKDPRTVERKILIVPRDAKEEPTTDVESPIDFDKTSECDTKECCICMKTFRIYGATDIEMADAEDTSEDRIVRTGQTCGHLFHHRCIASWVGGRWEAGGNNEPRPARHTTCPLCRRDFRPNR